jgi:hypothetical protein
MVITFSCVFYWQQLVTLYLQHLVCLWCADCKQCSVSVIAVERLLGHCVHVHKAK